jgi:hypothetical protein
MLARDKSISVSVLKQSKHALARFLAGKNLWSIISRQKIPIEQCILNTNAGKQLS